MGNRYGLVLTAGGARGAYQAGVLKRVGEIASQKKASPFSIVSGASAGAINGSMLAAGCDDFALSTRTLSELWCRLEVQDVFKTDLISLGKGARQWMRDLSLGGFMGGGSAQSLLDAAPLQTFLTKNLPMDGIAKNIEAGNLYALSVSATNYLSGISYSFIQGQVGHPLWSKNRRLAVSSPLRVEHICASCSIPIIFQPVKVDTGRGKYYFGDGSLRLIAPLSPAIRLGATHLFAIGIRSQAAAEVRSRAELLTSVDTSGAIAFQYPAMKMPPLAQIIGTILNAIFLDHLDADLEHVMRMNEFLNHYGVKDGGSAGSRAEGLREPMRLVTPLAIHPSVDLASVAEQFSHRMPRMVRYFLEGLGTAKAQSSDLLSYLLFDSQYTQALVDIGYQDASAQVDAIEAFLAGETTQP